MLNLKYSEHVFFTSYHVEFGYFLSFTDGSF